MVIVGLDYGHAGQMTLDEITGGSPYLMSDRIRISEVQNTQDLVLQSSFLQLRSRSINLQRTLGDPLSSNS